MYFAVILQIELRGKKYKSSSKRLSYAVQRIFKGLYSSMQKHYNHLAIVFSCEQPCILPLSACVKNVVRICMLKFNESEAYLQRFVNLLH